MDEGSIRQRGAVALLSGADVLLIHPWRDGHEYLVVPGGGVEPGETLRREALTLLNVQPPEVKLALAALAR
jgi:8-oxo-dGTP pyrophosphatase MutT (NUDIX family)